MARVSLHGRGASISISIRTGSLRNKNYTWSELHWFDICRLTNSVSSRKSCQNVDSLLQRIDVYDRHL